MTASVAVVRASAGDAEMLAELASRTFRQAFAADNEAADMDAYVADSFSVGRLAAELADPASSFFVARGEPAEGPLGYAKLRAGQADPSVTGPAPVEIERIYVTRRALGRGVGARLMATCLEEARRRGFRTVWLGVWDRNPRAMDFYRRWGFEHVGEHDFVLGSEVQTDLVFARPVDPRDAGDGPGPADGAPGSEGP